MERDKLELMDIAQAGASLVVDGSKFDKLELIDIAKSIQNGCMLEIANCQTKTKYELVDIATAAPGKVRIRLTA